MTVASSSSSPREVLLAAMACDLSTAANIVLNHSVSYDEAVSYVTTNPMMRKQRAVPAKYFQFGRGGGSTTVVLQWTNHTPRAFDALVCVLFFIFISAASPL